MTAIQDKQTSPAANVLTHEVLMDNATSVIVDYPRLSTSNFHFTGNPPQITDPLFIQWNAVGIDTAVDLSQPLIVTAMTVNTSPGLPVGQYVPSGSAVLSVRLSGARTGRYLADGASGSYFEIRLDPSDGERIACVVNCLARRDATDTNVNTGDPDRMLVLDNVYIVDHD